MKYYLVVDTNVIVSAFISKHRPKFNLDISMVDAVLDKLAEIAENVPGETFEGCLPDPKDIMFVEVAQSIPGSNIVTGNVKHFPGIQNIVDQRVRPGLLLTGSDPVFSKPGLTP